MFFCSRITYALALEKSLSGWFGGSKSQNSSRPQNSSFFILRNSCFRISIDGFFHLLAAMTVAVPTIPLPSMTCGRIPVLKTKI